MPKLSREELKDEFRDSLEGVWGVWNDWFSEKPNLNPFRDTEEILDVDIDSDVLRVFYSNLYYVLGVHVALGWDVHNPSGPKEWSPL